MRQCLIFTITVFITLALYFASARADSAPAGLMDQIAIERSLYGKVIQHTLADDTYERQATYRREHLDEINNNLEEHTKDQVRRVAKAIVCADAVTQDLDAALYLCSDDNLLLDNVTDQVTFGERLHNALLQNPFNLQERKEIRRALKEIRLFKKSVRLTANNVTTDCIYDKVRELDREGRTFTSLAVQLQWPLNQQVIDCQWEGQHFFDRFNYFLNRL